MESFLIWIPLPKTQRRFKTLRYDKFELANRCPKLGQNNDSQCRHRICNERQSLAIAMYRTVEYENIKKYFWNSVALLCLALQIQWRHWVYRHMACGAMSYRASKFLLAESISKETLHIFVPKRWNRFFAIYVVRLAL